MTRLNLMRMAKRVHLVFALLLTLSTLTYLMPRTVQAADGDLDAGFGTGDASVPAGVARTDFGANQNDVAFALATQSVGGNAGKIIAGGRTQNTMTAMQDFALARYNPNGTLDTSFGQAMTGKVTTARLDLCGRHFHGPLYGYRHQRQHRELLIHGFGLQQLPARRQQPGDCRSVQRADGRLPLLLQRHGFYRQRDSHRARLFSAGRAQRGGSAGAD